MSSQNMTIDIRCAYKFSITVGSPGLAEGPLIIDSLVLVPDIGLSSIYQQAGM